ncbi:hypothetical protein C0991_006038 [Blastosporella zonata]|nr:hypothetical protein C0991_006038 [Blastosporella zonata]
MKHTSSAFHTNKSGKLPKKRASTACFNCRESKLKCSSCATDSRCQRCVDRDLVCEKGPVGTSPTSQLAKPSVQHIPLPSSGVNPSPASTLPRSMGAYAPQFADFNDFSSFPAAHIPPQLSGPPMQQTSYFTEFGSPLSGETRGPVAGIVAQPSSSANYQPTYAAHSPPREAIPTYNFNVSDFYNGRVHEPHGYGLQAVGYAFNDVALTPHNPPGYIHRDPPGNLPDHFLGHSSATHDLITSDTGSPTFGSSPVWGYTSHTSLGQGVYDHSASTADGSQRTDADAERTWQPSY